MAQRVQCISEVTTGGHTCSIELDGGCHALKLQGCGACEIRLHKSQLPLSPTVVGISLAKYIILQQACVRKLRLSQVIDRLHKRSEPWKWWASTSDVNCSTKPVLERMKAHIVSREHEEKVRHGLATGGRCGSWGLLQITTTCGPAYTLRKTSGCKRSSASLFPDYVPSYSFWSRQSHLREA